MNAQPLDRPADIRVSWLGLFIALFAMLLVRQAVNWYWPEPNFNSAITKETGLWLSALLLVLIIWNREQLTLKSVGIGTSSPAKSIGWGFLLAVASILVAIVLVHVTGYGHGPGSAA